MYTEWGYITLVLFLVLGRCWFLVLSPGCFIPDSLWIVRCLGSVPCWHDVIVFVRHRTRAARLYCFSVPTIVTRTLLFATLTCALHLFFSNIQTQQLIHDLNIPHTKEQHAAVKYSFGWITWVLGKLLCRRYYGSCAVGIAEAVPSVLPKLCRRYCGSCAVGIAEAVPSVLRKLCCRYYGSCTVGITEAHTTTLQMLSNSNVKITIARTQKAM